MFTDSASGMPFDVLVAGCFGPAHVEVQYRPEARPTTPEVEAAIGRAWDLRADEAQRDGRLLYNGDLLRYVTHAVRGDGPPVLELVVGPTCYRDFVGTNLYGQALLPQVGWACFANPVGTTATLICADGRLCYGRRSAKVAYHAGYVHTFGGALEGSDRAGDGRIDVFVSVTRELEEELGLHGDELHELVCVGLIRDREIYQPEMLFEARLDLTSGELRQRWLSAAARDEHEELVELNDHPDAVVPFIERCGPIAPVAVGALFAHGWKNWGDGWVQTSARRLGPGRAFTVPRPDGDKQH